MSHYSNFERHKREYRNKVLIQESVAAQICWIKMDYLANDAGDLAH